MPIRYNQVNLSINGSYILADSISVSNTNTLKPIFNFNNNIPFDNVPTTLRGSILISYYMEPLTDINYTTISGILNDTSVSYPSIINIGENYITGYLNKYELQLTPNGLVKSNCSFDIYYALTGNLISSNDNDSALYDTQNSSGIANYWSAQFYSGNSIVSDNKILQLNYSADISLVPIYKIGSSTPVQVSISNISETFDILSEIQTNIGYSGQLLDSSRPDLQNLILSGINAPASITIPLTGFLLRDSKYNINMDSLILFNITYSRSR